MQVKELDCREWLLGGGETAPDRGEWADVASGCILAVGVGEGAGAAELCGLMGRVSDFSAS